MKMISNIFVGVCWKQCIESGLTSFLYVKCLQLKGFVQ